MVIEELCPESYATFEVYAKCYIKTAEDVRKAAGQATSVVVQGCYQPEPTMLEMADAFEAVSKTMKTEVGCTNTTNCLCADRSGFNIRAKNKKE